MNEASSFCDGSWSVFTLLRFLQEQICLTFFMGRSGTGANLTNTSVPFILPGEPGSPVLGMWSILKFATILTNFFILDYPEW